MKALKISIVVLLVFSLGANIGLIVLLKRYQVSLADATLSRHYIEELLRSYDVDLSYEQVKYHLIKASVGEVRESNTDKISGLLITDFDSKVIAIDSTRLFFKNDLYAGSQVEWTRKCFWCSIDDL